jgi:large subunit ribosomal protein L12e
VLGRGTLWHLQRFLEVVPSASALIIKDLKKTPSDRMRQKNIKKSRSTIFAEIVNIA